MNNAVKKNPFVLFTLVIVAGILMGRFFLPVSLSLYMTIGLLALTIIVTFIPYLKNIRYIILLLALFSAASARYFTVSSLLPEHHITFNNISQIKEVSGIVTQTQYRNDGKHKYVVSTRWKKENNEKRTAEGKVLVTTNKIKQKYQYGDLLTIKGDFRRAKGQRNPGQFDYRAYLASKDIYVICTIKTPDSISVMDRQQGSIFVQYIIDPVKSFCANSIDTYLSSENSGILKALLLGEKQDIDRNILDQFKNVGVVHVLAISGLHVGFIMLFVFGLISFFRLNFKIKSIILILFLFTYVVLINFKAPVVRASLMASLFLIGKISERKTAIFNIIFTAAFIILLVEPRELFNPGFQFSFTAVLSIIYGYQKLDQLLPLKTYLEHKTEHKNFLFKILKYVWTPFLVSLAAVIGTMPLTIYYYGILPVFALLANLIVIPLIGLIVLLGIFLLLISLFSKFLAFGLGNLMDDLFHLLKFVVLFFDELPYSHLDMPIPSALIVLLLLLLVYFVFNIKERKFQILTVGLAGFVFIFSVLKNRHFDTIKVTFLDVGQGDACYLQFPNGESMLVDGGDASFGWDQGKNTIVPFLKYEGCNRLKYVVASHAHNDHIGGLIEVLNRIDVDTLVLSHYQFNSKIFKNLISLSKNKNIPIRYVARGDRLFPDAACRVYVLHPTTEFATAITYDGAECNNSSVVLKIQHGDNGILLPGDLEQKGEEVVLSYAGFLESEILKVGHHGSKTSSSENLLNYVQPLAGIVSVAEKNKFRHPYPGTINRLRQYAVKDFLTSKEGAVVFQIGTKDIKKVNWRNNIN